MRVLRQGTNGSARPLGAVGFEEALECSGLSVSSGGAEETEVFGFGYIVHDEQWGFCHDV